MEYWGADISSDGYPLADEKQRIVFGDSHDGSERCGRAFSLII